MNNRINLSTIFAALALGFILGAGSLRLAIDHEIAYGSDCRVIALDADHATPDQKATLDGADYVPNNNSGFWIKNNQIIGISQQEDSIILTPDCYNIKEQP